MITPSELGRPVRRCQQRLDFGSVEEANEVAIEALLWDGQDALDEGGVRWLAGGGETEEGADGGEPRVTGPRAVTPVLLEMVEEGTNEGGVYVIEEQVGRGLAKAFLGEAEEKPEGVAVAVSPPMRL